METTGNSNLTIPIQHQSGWPHPKDKAVDMWEENWQKNTWKSYSAYRSSPFLSFMNLGTQKKRNLFQTT